MSEFAGIVRRDGQQIDPAIAARLTNGVGGVGRPRAWHGGTAMLVHRPLRHDEIAATALLPAETDNGLTVVTNARLDEPGDVARALGGSGDGRSSAALVVAACAAWGPRAIERLNGNVAYAAWDDRRGELTLACDALGTRPIYYADRPPYLFFATTLQVLLAMPEVPRDIDDLILAQYLTIEPQDPERTLYRHIRRVPPGGTLTVRGGDTRVARYWTVENIADVRLRRDDDYVEAARAILDRAVECRLPRGGQVATMVSGGLDSAGVTATVARLLGDARFPAFHRAPGGAHPYDAIDETALVQAVAARYPNIDLRIIADDCAAVPEVDREMEAAMFAVPRMASVNAIWFESLTRAVTAAAPDLLLAGGCGNLTLSWEGRPSFAADLRGLRFGSAWNAVKRTAAAERRSIRAVLASQLIRPLVPRAMLLARHRARSGGRLPWATYSVVSEAFLQDIEYVRHARDADYDMPFHDSPGMNVRAARLDALQGQTNRDKAGAGRRLGGVAGLDPYADRRMVEFTLGLPDDQFWRGGTDRWLARRVLADRLPAALIDQKRRGLQCPEWYSVLTPRRDDMAAAIERIERSPLASRVVDVPRMKALLDSWPADADAAKGGKQMYAHALSRGISMGAFLRQYEGGNG